MISNAQMTDKNKFRFIMYELIKHPGVFLKATAARVTVVAQDAVSPQPTPFHIDTGNKRYQRRRYSNR